MDYTYAKLYGQLIMGIDGYDNGVEQYSAPPLYHINTHLATRIGRLNMPDNDKKQNDTMFARAMELAEEELLWQVYAIAKVKFPGADIVKKAYEKRKKFHPSGKLMLLRNGCVWKDHLNRLERPGEEKLLFVLCGGHKKGSYKVQGVPDKLGSFGCRQMLRKEWWGLKDKELEKASGIKGAIFVHASGFLGVGKSLKAVRKMAEKSMPN